MSPLPWLFAALAAAAPATPTEAATLRRLFLEGDLVRWSRGRVLLAEQGEDVHHGELGLLDDLSRLSLCWPLGPVPSDERSEWIGPRLLARLERVRLERLLREGTYRNGPLSALASGDPVFQTAAEPQTDALVRWPREQERWPEETSEAPAFRSACPSAPGAWKEPVAAVFKARRALRIAAEHSLYPQILAALEGVPATVGAQVALAHLEAQGESLRLSPSESRALEAVLRQGPGAVASAGLLRLARIAEQSADPQRAEALYQGVLGIEARSAAEDSRARVRLVLLLEPRYEALINLVDQARDPRPEDRPILDNAKARALYALGRFEALQTFGRRFLDQPRTTSPHDLQTQELLLRLSLRLEPGPALAWAEEMSKGEASNDRTARLETLAELALSARNLDLATSIYDRLRLEAQAEASRRGPRAAAAEARYLAARALVEVERDDPEAFAGFLDELVALAEAEASRALARHAPHRELARLDQALIPRLVDEVDAQPGRRRFAGVLLETTVHLAPSGGRWRPILQGYHDPLVVLAGPYAQGREGPPRKSPKPQRRIRQLGEVIIPRLPPALDAADLPTDAPAAPTFLVYPGPDGRLLQGMPWDGRRP